MDAGEESEPGTGRRFRDERNVWLATVRANGRPHLVPVWFVFVDDSFWIGTGRRSVKASNVAAQPSVSVCLEDGNAPVVAEGKARLVPPPYPDAVIAAFATKYAWDVTRRDDPDIGELAMLRIDVARWLMGGPG